ncbi:ATP-binding cassette domain-containing protein [Microbacterium horticulturae]|uniref:ATP-binding cassette domain-containing protein n=1 Tax=Microbacterium horticulturae TaxID=3028316 RepID=A0ABY8BW99_9MICO|nr:ATP-binding cassette domain-containing protein [Microbacterium sp. KACC 23027]WEG08471.1 ATP-binding cassette domain-containing protein [Microbacterium sp. KACC 23027]
MNPLLELEGLCVDYGRGRHARRVVDDVSLTIDSGETLALVGESGSGKTTIGRAVLGMIRPASGRVRIDGVDLAIRSLRERRRWAGTMQAIFQDPYRSLNPSLRVGVSIGEPLSVSSGVSARERARVVADVVERVGLPPDTRARFPVSFSGGQRQRIGIARALSVRPRLIVCDEPTSALDVSTQRQVLDLLAEIQQQTSVGYLFISHDLAVVRSFADRVAVLQSGRIVEIGSARQVCEDPQHAYTKALVAAAPVPDPRIQRRRRIEAAA